MGKKSIDGYLTEVMQESLANYISRDQVVPIVKDAIDKLFPRDIHISLGTANGNVQVNGRQHYRTPLLAKLLSLNLPVLVWGPRGTGKSFVAEKLAEAMGYQPILVECNRDMSSHTLTGYHWGEQFIQGMLYPLLKNGGFVIFDELDRLSAGTSVALNSLLAGGLFTFANRETVRKSPDFHILGLANTQLTGGTESYRSAERQDLAFIDRWVYLEWPIDPGLEASCVGLQRPSVECHIEQGGPMEAGAWLEVVNIVRDWAEKNHLVTVPGQRATILGQRLLDSGIGFQHACDCVLFRGFTKEQIQHVVSEHDSTFRRYIC